MASIITPDPVESECELSDSGDYEQNNDVQYGSDSDEFDSDHNEPLANISTSNISTNYRWRKRVPIPVQSKFSGIDFPEPPSEDLIPRQYFDYFFDSNLFDHTAQETNLYSVQTSGKSINTNAKEIEQFVGILVEMGILKYPQYRMYWDPTTRIPIIANVMGLTRFENIIRYFHLNENSQIPTRGSDNFDRLYKVRPLLDSILGNCHKIPQEENQSTDEQVIPTKGRSSLRQYLPKKNT